VNADLNFNIFQYADDTIFFGGRHTGEYKEYQNNFKKLGNGAITKGSKVSFMVSIWTLF